MVLHIAETAFFIFIYFLPMVNLLSLPSEKQLCRIVLNIFIFVISRMQVHVEIVIPYFQLLIELAKC